MDNKAAAPKLWRAFRYRIAIQVVFKQIGFRNLAEHNIDWLDQYVVRVTKNTGRQMIVG